MSNLLRSGAEWLAEQQSRHTAERVHYTRSASVTEMAAMLARADEVDTGDGVISRIGDQDFIIRVDQLLLDDIPVEPVDGDRIVVGTLGEGKIYEVMGTAGEKSWRFTDSFHTQYRIHTKYVGAQ